MLDRPPPYIHLYLKTRYGIRVQPVIAVTTLDKNDYSLLPWDIQNEVLSASWRRCPSLLQPEIFVSKQHNWDKFMIKGNLQDKDAEPVPFEPAVVTTFYDERGTDIDIRPFRSAGGDRSDQMILINMDRKLNI